MIKIVIYSKSFNANQEISALLELKYDRLYFAGLPVDPKSVMFSSSPYKVKFTLMNYEDIQQLREVCSGYEDIKLSVEVTSHNYDADQQVITDLTIASSGGETKLSIHTHEDNNDDRFL